MRLAAIEAIRSANALSVGGGNAASSGRKTPDNSSDMFGHPWPIWFQMRDIGYEHIAARAREQRTTPYAALWNAIETGVNQDLGNPWRQLPNLLGYIGDLSYETLHLVVTALVVYQDGVDHPGPGFRLAASHSLIPIEEAPPAGKDNEWMGMTQYQHNFWKNHCSALFQHFRA